MAQNNNQLETPLIGKIGQALVIIGTLVVFALLLALAWRLFRWIVGF